MRFDILLILFKFLLVSHFLHLSCAIYFFAGPGISSRNQQTCAVHCRTKIDPALRLMLFVRFDVLLVLQFSIEFVRFYTYAECYVFSSVPDVVRHQMLIYKLQGDVHWPFFVFIKLFLSIMLGTKCLYTGFRGILVDRSL